MKEGDRLSLRAICERLSIAEATGRNWIRLGKLRPAGYDGRSPYFLEEEMQRVLGEIQESKGRLKTRRNKGKAVGSALYRAYLEDGGECAEAVEALRPHAPFTPRQLRLILAEYALQTMCQVRGIAALPPVLPRLRRRKLALGGWSRLLFDLAGEITAEEEEWLAPLPLRAPAHRRGEDFLGFAYLSLQEVWVRKAAGAYYTPAPLARRMAEELAGRTTQGRILDPCCGTGNFLLYLAQAVGDPLRLRGQDRDPVAVTIARINLAMACNFENVDPLYRMITCGDSLRHAPEGPFAGVIGNPPWGSSLSRQERRELRGLYRTAGEDATHSSDLFLELGLRCLASGGELLYLLPQAVLAVGTHREARALMMEQSTIRGVEYLGEAFPGVQCPAVLLSLSRGDGAFSTRGVYIRDKRRSFAIGGERDVSGGELLLNVTDEEYACLRRMERESAITLKDRAEFALGIVTGDNSRYLSEEPRPGWEPVLRGSDLWRYRTRPATAFLQWQPQKFQQAAPLERYRHSPKLLYRFVGENLVFAYDEKGTLSLNSCNVLIPKVEGVEPKYLLAVLNARPAQFYYSKRFGAVKVLRSHLEQIPIPRCGALEQREIVALVERMLAGAGDSQALYNQIDERMMELYRLPAEERALIGAALAKNSLFLPQ